MGASRMALPWVKLWESFAEILISIMPQSCGICGASHSQLQQFRPRVPAYGRKQGNGGTQWLRQISMQPATSEPHGTGTGGSFILKAG
jgi:hypothetical protein